MKCIIRIVDGVPFEHPIMLDNFQQAFPDIDLDQPLPEGFAWFERTLIPPIADDQIFVSEQSRYEFHNGMWTDVWDVRAKNQDELNADAQQTLNAFKDVAAAQANIATDLALKAAWQKYHDEIEAVLSANPFVISYPVAPRLDENGNLRTLTESGTAPDVIG